ncbi:MAG: hypothetical protein ABR502_11585 [Chitinophagaceae bacterium]
MRYSFVLLLLQCFTISSAQRVVDVSKGDINVMSQGLFYSIGGEPFVTAKFVRLVKGSLFFNDEWTSSYIVLKNGKEIRRVMLKLNLLDNAVYYIDELGRELIAKSTIRKVILTDAITNENYRFIHSTFLPVTAQIKSGWYLWLHTGQPASLYKLYNKNLSEQTPYGSATIEQRIKTTEKYFVLYNNTMFRVKHPKDLPAVLANKKPEPESYYSQIAKDKVSLDDKFEKMVVYYNSLVK